MKCKLCGKEITLVPSAQQRADKYGGRSGDYSNLFTVHAECQLVDREQKTRELMARIRQKETHDVRRIL